MHISTRILGAAALLVTACSQVQAAALAGWNFTGLTNFGPSTMTATQMVDGLTATLSRGPGLSTSGTTIGAAYGGAGISSFGASGPDGVAASVAAGDYLVFRLEAAEGVTFSLDSIDAYSVIRTVTSGANILLYWQYSVDGGAFTSLSTPTPLSSGSSGGGKAAVNLSNITALQDVSSVEFRFGFYGQNSAPTSATGVVFRNGSSGGPLTISGTMTAVPEPSVAALAIVGVCAVFVMTRRLRKPQP